MAIVSKEKSFLALYPRTTILVDIVETIAGNKGNMGFKHSKHTFCSELHGLSVRKMNLPLRCVRSEVDDLQYQLLRKKATFLHKSVVIREQQVF